MKGWSLIFSFYLYISGPPVIHEGTAVILSLCVKSFI
jgi:hypothetical protein